MSTRGLFKRSGECYNIAMKNVRMYAAAGAVLVLDRLSKMLWGSVQRTLIPGVLELHGTQNGGVAFGAMNGSGLWLSLGGLVLCIAMLVWLHRADRGKLCQYGTGLMLGGGLSNLIDRLLYGAVIDFIDPVFLHWFVFNIADAAVVCGAVLAGIGLILNGEERK